MKVYSVSEINTIIKNHIEKEETFKFICIEGEPTNIKYQEKHMYLTLKDDENNKINCAGFFYKFKDIPLNLNEKNKIKVYGNIVYYPANGQVQIIASKIEKSTSVGDLYKKIEELKKIYYEKGYFDEAIKKELPYNPRIIGVVTSDTGDAIRDIIKNTHILDKNVDIYLYPAKVQGEYAAKSIAKGIEFFNNNIEKLNIECLIVGRGGGSLEDLWAFNEEEVVEAIYNSKLPVITAIGHEADTLLADYVSDFRASTPTQAPYSIIKNRQNIEKEFLNLSNKALNILKQKIDKSYNELYNIKNSYYIKKFYESNILLRYQNLDYKKNELEKMKIKLFSNKEKYNIINSYKMRLNSIINFKINKNKDKIKQLSFKLEKYDVNKLFERGYTLTYIDGKLLKDVKKIKKGSKLTTLYFDRRTVISEVNNEKN